MHYSRSNQLTSQLQAGSRFSIQLYKAFGYNQDLGYNLDQPIEFFFDQSVYNT
jgi:hypothetical protein